MCLHVPIASRCYPLTLATCTCLGILNRTPTRRREARANRTAETILFARTSASLALRCAPRSLTVFGVLVLFSFLDDRRLCLATRLLDLGLGHRLRERRVVAQHRALHLSNHFPFQHFLPT